MMLIFLIALLTLLSGSTLSYTSPIAKKNPHHYNTLTVDIRSITTNSAVMEWIVPQGSNIEDRGIDSFKVKCVQIKTSTTKDVHFRSKVTNFTPTDASHVLLEGLKPASNYSCVLLTTDDRSNSQWTRLIEPMIFTTHSTNKDSLESTQSKGRVTSVDTSCGCNTYLNFKYLFGLILFFVFIAFCVGGFVIWKVYNKVKFINREEDREKIGISQRLRYPRRQHKDGKGPATLQKATLNSKGSGKLSEIIAAKYGIPRPFANKPSMAIDSTVDSEIPSTKPLYKACGLLHTPTGDEKMETKTLQEFDTALMRMGEIIWNKNSQHQENIDLFSECDALITNQLSSPESCESINVPSLFSTTIQSQAVLRRHVSQVYHCPQDNVTSESGLEFSNMKKTYLGHLQVPLIADSVLPARLI